MRLLYLLMFGKLSSSGAFKVQGVIIRLHEAKITSTLHFIVEDDDCTNLCNLMPGTKYFQALRSSARLAEVDVHVAMSPLLISSRANQRPAIPYALYIKI